MEQREFYLQTDFLRWREIYIANEILWFCCNSLIRPERLFL